MNRARHAPWLLGLLMLSLLPVAASAARSVTLDRWTESDLIPYLVEQLGNHPRFRGEPVMLVALREGEVLARIDGLTERLRARMFEALLDKPGIVLAWRPDNTLPGAAAAALPCIATPAVAYYVGIEVLADRDGSTRVAVRALDIGERSWVSGFGKEWSGRLNRGERTALARSAVDGALRGLRNLPFEPVQTDLAAAFLAQRLACALARGAGAGTTIAVGANTDPQLLPLAELVARYLSRSAGMRIAVGKPADLVLLASEHAIADGLVQWWMSLEPAPGAVDTLQTHSAMAYARQPAALPAQPAQRAPAKVAAVQKRPSPVASGGRAAATLPAGLHARLRIAHSARPGCADDPDWLRGAQRLEPDARIEPGDCFLIQPEPSPAVAQFWLVQSTDGALLRADPAPDCMRAGARAPRRWAGGEGVESHFLIAAGDINAAGRLRRHIEALPAACRRRDGLHGSALKQWRLGLERLLDSLGSRAAWQGVKLRHSDQSLQANR